MENPYNKCIEPQPRTKTQSFCYIITEFIFILMTLNVIENSFVFIWLCSSDYQDTASPNPLETKWADRIVHSSRGRSLSSGRGLSRGRGLSHGRGLSRGRGLSHGRGDALHVGQHGAAVFSFQLLHELQMLLEPETQDGLLLRKEYDISRG